ncbi:MAG: hypothetical protein HY999_04185, partial [Nitrospinae bacterium]|nr:hypothetical protein [Nitrospinota bacterium]
MNRKYLSFISILVVISVLLIHAVLYADRIETQSLRLDLSECISLALANNP